MWNWSDPFGDLSVGEMFRHSKTYPDERPGARSLASVMGCGAIIITQVRTSFSMR